MLTNIYYINQKHFILQNGEEMFNLFNFQFFVNYNPFLYSFNNPICFDLQSYKKDLIL